MKGNNNSSHSRVAVVNGSRSTFHALRTRNQGPLVADAIDQGTMIISFQVGMIQVSLSDVLVMILLDYEYISNGEKLAGENLPGTGRNQRTDVVFVGDHKRADTGRKKAQCGIVLRLLIFIHVLISCVMKGDVFEDQRSFEGANTEFEVSLEGFQAEHDAVITFADFPGSTFGLEFFDTGHLKWIVGGEQGAQHGKNFLFVDPIQAVELLLRLFFDLN